MQATIVQTPLGAAQGPVKETGPDTAKASLVQTSPSEAQTPVCRQVRGQHKHL
jgi:hypothetical protein